MRYYIAIDGGGTKTEAVLADESRNTLASVIGASTNPNDIGESEAVERIVNIVRELCKSLPERRTVTALHAGISGAGNRPSLVRSLRERLPEIERVTVASDVQNLIRAGLGDGDGACLICGTGSVCFVKRDERLDRIGGWGWLLDRGGSGYDLGRDALSAILEAHDGRSDATELADIVAKRLGGYPWEKLSEIYDGGKPLIASLAPCVFEADDRGDMIAGQILERNIAYLAGYVEAACQMSNETLDVVLGGGVFEHHPSYVERLRRVCADLDANLYLSPKRQLDGALSIAMDE